MYGLSRSDYEDEQEEIELSPEMMQSWETYCALGTQWRVSESGPYGFDYNVLPFLFRVYNVSDEEACLNDIRVMEQYTLRIIKEQNK